MLYIVGQEVYLYKCKDHYFSLVIFVLEQTNTFVTNYVEFDNDIP